MGVYLNPDNMDFQELRNSEICVDKTLLINYTNSIIRTKDKFICVARPRRFGKSTDAQMLVAYYSKGCNSSNLFDDLHIASYDSYQKHLNQHDVIYFDVQKILNRVNSVEELKTMLTRNILKEIKRVYPDEELYEDGNLASALENIYAEYKQSYIFIIDEWDCVLRKKMDNQDKYIEFLSDIFKSQSHVELAYMTGILPIKKIFGESSMNVFKEITMISPTPLAQFMGFTENEVKDLCLQYQMDFEKMKSWYDGYHIANNISLYNPRSIVQAIKDKEYGNYWSETGTFETLKDYIAMDMDGLKEDVLKILTGEEIEVNTSKFKNDMSTFKTKDDVLTLLVHLGYLGYNKEHKTVYLPNKEVEDSFINAIEDSNWNNINQALKESKQLLEATWNLDSKKVASMIEESHDKEIDLFHYHDENSIACLLKLSYWYAKEFYDIKREDVTGKGRCDMIFHPIKSHVPAIIIELKMNSTPDYAIQQIIDKNYMQKVNNSEIILVGISYDSHSEHKKYKHHQVKIIKYTK